MEDVIKIIVETQDGERVELDAPTDMGLSVMEVMKANELDVAAICGGMAICATCHVEVRSTSRRRSAQRSKKASSL